VKTIDDFNIVVCSKSNKSYNFRGRFDIDKYNPNYQLSLEDLKTFLDCTKRSNYYINNVTIDCGEPLLWDNFNSGVVLIKESKCVGSITISSDGEGLGKISKKAWKAIDTLSLNISPAFSQQNLLDRLRMSYPLKFNIVYYEYYRKYTKEMSPTTPCNCVNSGPTLYNKRVYLHCGIEVLNTASNLSLKGLSSPLKENYLENRDDSKVGNLEHCRFCTSNHNWTFNVSKIVE